MPFFIPGICGIIGPQGSGKSFAALKVGLQYANQIEYNIAFNFQVDLQRLYFYCLDMGYYWLAHKIYRNQVRCEIGLELEDFMRFPKTIYILDEAGVYLNTRKWKSLSTTLIDDLAQIRHDGKILWWIAQYDEMVDKILRNLSSSYIYVNSTLRFNKKLGNSEMIFQAIYLYYAKEFKVFNSKVLEKYSGLKFLINARRLAHYHIEGPLSKQDKKLFQIYSSFGSRVGDDIINNQYFHHNKGFNQVQFNDNPKQININQIISEVRGDLPDCYFYFDY